MKCPKCQFDNPEKAKFCNECGGKLETQCPGCSSPNPLGAKFCNECGHSLAGTISATPVDLSFEEKLEKIQRYLPDRLTEKILSQRGKIEGERKQVTVMFCDIEGFSQIAEKLGPEKVYSLMDEVFEILIHKVHEYGGTVNEMTGDGIIALFGAPIALEDAPQRAIRSALAIQRDIARFSDHKKTEIDGIIVRMRVGINTGPVVVGSLGNDLRVEFKAVGDTVNLASRMEGLAEPGTVYVTEDTFKLTEGLFRFEALGEMQVKGKEVPVRAYRVIAPSTRRTRFDVSAERGLTPFLGRERELELLLDGLERARAGRGQAFSIMGEAGVGKSRLLYEFRKAIASEDVTFLEGRCLSYSTNVVYHPIIDLLQSTFDIQEGDDDDLITEKVERGLKELGADEATTLPFILELLSVKDSGIESLELSPEARKDRTLESLRIVVLKGSEVRPLIMAVEDLHWVDKSSEDAFKILLDAISGAQVLLIFTYRPEFVHTWGAKSYHNQVNLNRLSNHETLGMAAHILGTEGIGYDLEELILQKTEGIPFFVEEFLKSLRDLEMIEWRDSGYYLARDIQEVAIPSTIQDVIMARVDALTEGAKNVLQTGSAIGREFSCELIKRVTGVPQPEITSYLSALRDSELLYERGIFPQATYIFRHSLTQEVAYGSLLLKRRNEIHEKIGQAIEDLYPDRPEEFCELLAHHYSRSDNLDKAYYYLKSSGDKAARNYSNWEAFRFYKAAIDVLGKLPDTGENRRKGIDIRLAMYLPMRCIGYPEDSLQILQDGERLAIELDDQRSLSIIYTMFAVLFIQTGGTQATEYGEKAFQAAESVQDLELMAPTGFDLCIAYLMAGELPKVINLAPAVIDLCEKTQRESETFGRGWNLYSALMAVYGHATGGLGNFKEGEALLEKALNFALGINDLVSIGLVETQYASLFAIKGDGENAIKHAVNAVKYGDEAQVVPFSAVGLLLGGLGYYMLGDFKTAAEHFEKSLEMQRDAGISQAQPIIYQGLGQIHLDSGSFKDALACAEEAIKLAQNNGEKASEARARGFLGVVLMKMDPSQYEKAEEHILQAIRMADELQQKPYSFTMYFSLGEPYADAGQTEKALETLKKAEAAFQEMGMDYWLRRTQEVLARIQG
jgi:class 3 adenylate cyclase/tetratricopeptide (TPR) repeat protein